jgi:hypothetical protein
MSPRLAFRKATDLLPVTGPVSSQKVKATTTVAFSFTLLSCQLLRSRLKTDMSIFDGHRKSHLIATKLFLESVCL